MKKLILIGRSGGGKTTLIQALKGEKLRYQKTQAVEYQNILIDTPGEYIQDKMLGGALAVYSFEADVIGLIIQATDEYSLFPPCVAGMATREVIGIVTQIDRPDAKTERARLWLELAGCKRIFEISAFSREGIDELLAYLQQ